MSVNPLNELEPLKITCTSTDCEHGLHCFKQKKRKQEEIRTQQGSWMVEIGGIEFRLGGRCRACGIDLVDWDRVSRHDLRDVDYTFLSLKQEYIRHYYWHLRIDQHAKNHALRKGSIELCKYVEKRLRNSIGQADNFREGRQTPMHHSGNIVYYAQHATASCCRACAEEWHQIPPGRALTDAEIQYLTELAMRYIHERLPELQAQGQKIPPIRQPHPQGRKVS